MYLERLLLSGSFAHYLNYLINHELDLSGFDTLYRDDLTGITAYSPTMLLSVVLLTNNCLF